MSNQILTCLVILIISLNLSSAKLTLRTSAWTTAAPSLFLKIKSSSVGEYITDRNEKALYIFENDQPNKSNCNDECLKSYLPLLAENVTFPPDVASRLDASMVGLFRNAFGKYQVTYNKLPLYLYKLDVKEDDTKGHRRREFGGLWSLLRPDATPLDSRLGASLQKISNVNGISLTSTGHSSILLLPDVFEMRVNITESELNITQAYENLKLDFNTFNSTVVNSSNNTKFILIEKRLSNIDNLFFISQAYETYFEDMKLLINLVEKLNRMNNALTVKINYSVNFSISADSISNAKNLIYGLAIKDALDNANILLDPLNLLVDKDNSIRSINANAPEMIKIDPLNQNLFTKFDFNAKMMSIKALVSYNIKRKS